MLLLCLLCNRLHIKISPLAEDFVKLHRRGLILPVTFLEGSAVIGEEITFRCHITALGWCSAVPCSACDSRLVSYRQG